MEAIAYLEPLLKLEPSYNNPEIVGGDYGSGVIYLLIGNAHVELKRQREAIRYYEIYLRDFSDAPKASEIRALLQRLHSGLR